MERYFTKTGHVTSSSRISLLLLTCLFSLWPQRVEHDLAPDQLVVWNVGQGLWVTWARGADCFHYDIGGERADWRAIQRLCLHRRNRAHFSHWDLDHVNLAARARRYLHNLCLSHSPGGKAPRGRERQLESLPPCPSASSEQHANLWEELTPRSPASRSARSSNDASRIYLLERQVLLPGDASREIERRIRPSGLADVLWLVLGHHGSRTSTSHELVRHLPRLKIAIASARRKRYGHPHPLVIDRMQEHGVPVIKTEDWGHLRLKWPPSGT